MDHPTPARAAETARAASASVSDVAPTRRLRPLAAVVAAAVAGAALVAVPSIAVADTTGTSSTISAATLSWGFNDYSSFVIDATTGQATADTATSVRAFTVAGGTGSLDADHDGTIAFGDSSVSYKYNAGPGFAGAYVFSDLRLTVGESGTEGVLTADVAGSSQFVDASAARDDVTIATFDITSLAITDGALSLQTAAPDFAASETYPTGSWPLPFLATVASGGKAFWYASGSDPASATNASKKPLPMSVSATASVPQVAVAASYPAQGGLDVAVTGSGFAVANQGLYVAVGPVGLDLSKTNDAAYAAAFLTADWLDTSRIGEGGTIASTLHVDTDGLTDGGEYAVYTWNAHAHATTVDDSITTFPFDYASLANVVVDTVTSLAVESARLDYGRTGLLTASVPEGVTGTVRFSVSGVVIGEREIAGGEARIRTLATASVGTHSITATYLGDTTHAASVDTASYLVLKARPTLSATGSSYAKGKAPVVKVTLGRLPNGENATGQITLSIGGKVVRTASGSASARTFTITLPQAYGAKSSIVVTTKYVGSSKAYAVTAKTLTLKQK